MDERKSIISYRDKSKAEIILEFLNDQFTLAKDYPLELEENNGTEKYRSQWMLTLPEHVTKYSKTTEKMSIAADDFWKGWCACKRHFDLG